MSVSLWVLASTGLPVVQHRLKMVCYLLLFITLLLIISLDSGQRIWKAYQGVHNSCVSIVIMTGLLSVVSFAGALGKDTNDDLYILSASTSAMTAASILMAINARTHAQGMVSAECVYDLSDIISEKTWIDEGEQEQNKWFDSVTY